MEFLWIPSKLVFFLVDTWPCWSRLVGTPSRIVTIAQIGLYQIGNNLLHSYWKWPFIGIKLGPQIGVVMSPISREISTLVQSNYQVTTPMLLFCDFKPINQNSSSPALPILRGTSGCSSSYHTSGYMNWLDIHMVKNICIYICELIRYNHLHIDYHPNHYRCTNINRLRMIEMDDLQPRSAHRSGQIITTSLFSLTGIMVNFWGIIPKLPQVSG